MYYMIDNKDSFVYNLVAYMKELKQEIQVVRADHICLTSLDMQGIRGIIISPGPGHPKEAEIPLGVIEQYGEHIPVLGVCLGQQVLAYAKGGVVTKGLRPMHGKISEISHNSRGLFCNLPEKFSVTRYHSLVVQEDSVKEQFHIDAKAEDGAVMAISHKKLPLYAVQFHPEAILSQHGHAILQNFINICEEWWQRHD